MQSKLDHLQIRIWLEYDFFGTQRVSQQLNTTTTTKKPLRNLLFIFIFG